jgi:hypothetical protein
MPTVPAVRNVNDDTPRRDESSRHRFVPEEEKPAEPPADEGTERGGSKPAKRDGVGDHLDLYA